MKTAIMAICFLILFFFCLFMAFYAHQYQYIVFFGIGTLAGIILAELK